MGKENGYYPAVQQEMNGQFFPERQFRLVMPRNLSGLLHSVTESGFDWRALEERLRETKPFATLDLSPSHVGHCMGQVIEAQLDITLNHLARRRREVVYRPFRAEFETENYIITPTERSNLKIIKKGVERNDKKPTERYDFEYDGVVLVDGIPVVIETKATNNNGDRLTEVLQKKHIEEVITPIKEAFSTDTVGYAVATVTTANLHTLRGVRNFSRMGGMIRHFNISYEKLQEKTRELQQQAIIPRAFHGGF